MEWIILLLLPLFITAGIAGLSAAPWLPTRKRERETVLNQISFENVRKVIDLGCGDGTVLFAVARRYPEIEAVGYDISLVPMFIGWTRKLLHRNAYRNVHLRFGNLFTAPLDEADIVFVFLLSKAYPRLIAKFKNELPKDARVAIEAWPLPDAKPAETLRAEGTLPIYIYRAGEIK